MTRADISAEMPLVCSRLKPAMRILLTVKYSFYALPYRIRTEHLNICVSSLVLTPITGRRGVWVLTCCRQDRAKRFRSTLRCVNIERPVVATTGFTTVGGGGDGGKELYISKIFHRRPLKNNVPTPLQCLFHYFHHSLKNLVQLKAVCSGQW